MLAKKIISLQHPLVKHWVSLRSDRAYREEKKRLLLMGEKAIRELAEKIPIEALISLEETPKIACREAFCVTEGILEKITGLKNPDGYAAEVSLPEPEDLSGKSTLLILDGISDPGNLGTLLRTALALGWDGVIATPGTVDLFNDKALRAGKGAQFHLPYARLTQEETARLLEQNGIRPYLADLEGKTLDQANPKRPIALILSREAQGPSPWAERIAEKITIPMEPGVESLNVAASGAILLYALRPE